MYDILYIWTSKSNSKEMRFKMAISTETNNLRWVIEVDKGIVNDKQIVGRYSPAKVRNTFDFASQADLGKIMSMTYALTGLMTQPLLVTHISPQYSLIDE